MKSLCLPSSLLLIIALVFMLILVPDSSGGRCYALENGLGATPPMGWSTWCSYGPCWEDKCYEDQVLKSAAALKSNGMQALGYHWIIMDDCWAAGNRTENGTITWDPTRFPNGIPYLAEKLHSQGFKLGVYTSAGNTTCSSGGRPYPIAGSEGHYQLDMDTFASWEVDYVKVDWCGDVHSMPLDGIAVGAKDYKAVSHAINNTAPKRAMYLEGVAAEIFLLEETGKYVNSWRASTDHHDNWGNTRQVLLETFGLPIAKPGPGGWAYMDVLMTGGEGCPPPAPSGSHCPGMTDLMYQAEFTLWSLRQSPLVVSTNVQNMTTIMNEVLYKKELIDLHQDTRTPPGVSLGFLPDGDCGGYYKSFFCSLYLRKVYDGSVLAVMLNDYNLEMELTMRMSAIFPDAKTPVMQASGYNVWTGENVTVTNGSYTTNVVNQSVVALRLWPQN